MLNMNKRKNNKKGFTILIAVITAGILLIIAMSIGGIALKEQVLATANKESQIAFYAADTGMECALYWDQKKGAFNRATDGADSATLTDFVCNNIKDNDTNPTLGDTATVDYYDYTFMVKGIPVAGNTLGTCAIVKVTKSVLATSTKTYIQSYGYNTCEASPRRLERGIEAHY